MRPLLLFVYTYQVLFFNFRERPEQMFDRLTEVKVFNAKKVISDALIGSFKFDLGLVYDEVEHCFIHKWLLLTDPNDPSGGAKVRYHTNIHVHTLIHCSTLRTLDILI